MSEEFPEELLAHLKADEQETYKVLAAPAATDVYRAMQSTALPLLRTVAELRAENAALRKRVEELERDEG